MYMSIHLFGHTCVFLIKHNVLVHILAKHKLNTYLDSSNMTLYMFFDPKAGFTNQNHYLFDVVWTNKVETEMNKCKTQLFLNLLGDDPHVSGHKQLCLKHVLFVHMFGYVFYRCVEGRCLVPPVFLPFVCR